MSGHSKPIVVIPARGGSKRIPGKNWRPFCGRPIIEYAVETALRSNLFSDVIVSTDSEEVAKVAVNVGATVPFVRPAAIADDLASTAAAFTHALNEVDPKNVRETACCLYATTPFLDPDDLIQGLDMLESSAAECVFAATTYDAPIDRAFEAADDGTVRLVWPEHRLTRSNELPDYLHDVGQFYWVRTKPYRRLNDFFTLRCAALRIPRWRAHDIDTEDDWVRAEIIYQALVSKGALA